MSDEEWVQKLASAANITSHLNFLKLKLQGKENLVSDLYTHLKAFRSKLVVIFGTSTGQQLGALSVVQGLITAEATTRLPTSFACEIIKDLSLQFQ